MSNYDFRNLLVVIVLIYVAFWLVVMFSLYVTSYICSYNNKQGCIGISMNVFIIFRCLTPGHLKNYTEYFLNFDLYFRFSLFMMTIGSLYTYYLTNDTFKTQKLLTLCVLDVSLNDKSGVKT